MKKLKESGWKITIYIVTYREPHSSLAFFLQSMIWLVQLVSPRGLSGRQKVAALIRGNLDASGWTIDVSKIVRVESWLSAVASSCTVSHLTLSRFSPTQTRGLVIAARFIKQLGSDSMEMRVSRKATRTVTRKS